MTENKENEILLNIMYNGDYLMSDNKNIGHEVINLFQSDNGNNYIYVLPYGCMAKEHNDKIETILLVKRHNASLLEILAKAEELEQIIHLDDTRPNCQELIHKEQIKHIKNNDIKYGGIYLLEIMNDNDGSDIAFYVTFKAKRIVKPKERIFLTVDNKEDTKHSKNCENIYVLEDKNFAKQSPKMYINSEMHKNDYKALNNLINDKAKWKRNKDSKKVNINIKTSKEDTFIDIIRKGYDELTYSNLFKYIFEADKELFDNFVKKVLDLQNFQLDGNYTIERETGNIDLLIHNKNEVIVIENKIKSGINGICLDKKGNIIGSQLGKYEKFINKNFKKQNKSYFIFTPDYNIIDIEIYDKNKNYKLITYSKIYNFFNDKKRTKYKTKIPYYKEFLYALEKHAKEINNSNDIDAETRFVKAIIENKK